MACSRFIESHQRLFVSRLFLLTGGGCRTNLGISDYHSDKRSQPGLFVPKTLSELPM
jgi:hypothetical protein